MTDPPPLVGVDLGGTQIRAAVATGRATHGPPVRERTPAQAGPEAVLDAVVGLAREVTGGATPGGVAVGIPGPLDPRRGVVYAAPNLQGWSEVPARRMLEERLGAPVAIQNDARLAGFAEWTAGAGQGTDAFVFVTVSTGVGGALIIGGDLVAGAAGTAGELGHTPVSMDGPPCSQGHPGCLEGIGSGTAIAHLALAALESGEASILADQPAEHLDAQAVENAARAGDALADRIYRQGGRAVGRALGGLVNLLSPEVIVVGGGLIQAGDMLFGPLREGIRELAFTDALARCRVEPAALGVDAGLVGAVAWAVRCFGDEPQPG